MRWYGGKIQLTNSVAIVRERAYRNLVGKLDGKQPLGESNSSSKKNIRSYAMDIRVCKTEIMWDLDVMMGLCSDLCLTLGSTVRRVII
jgi:hypothetical protein